MPEESPRGAFGFKICVAIDRSAVCSMYVVCLSLLGER